MEYTITLPENQKPISLQELFTEEWLLPKKMRHLLRMQKGVLLDGKVADFHQVVTTGTQITLTLNEADYPYQPLALGDARKVRVLFEDEHLIVVDKPAGIKTHPNEATENNTMANHLAAYLAPKKARPYVVHRLDTDTSGVLLFAKTPLALPLISRLLEEKQIYRRYQAIVTGNLTHSQTITKKIGRSCHDRRKRVIDENRGQTAITHVEVHHHSLKESQVYCQLETGRTHQIRVHLAAIGHPIVGDVLYNPQGKQAKRLMLHAYQMTLIHPFSKEVIEIVTESGLWN
ncbi:RluA family pseudouridine synthase [Enterococcus sp. 2201sp1_2201st1_B8_2201SCRN_220225]|uniref:RluA family pseudouridine synthase n=1 Tax=unclassified Enterococcus TaxID=2608891 RepID=UPI0034A1CCFD